jgi:hypothetical protein
MRYLLAIAGALLSAGVSAQPTQTPAASEVLIVSIRILSPADPADRFAIIDAVVQPGAAPRPQPAEADDLALQASSPELRVLDADGAVLYRQLFTWSRVLTVPPAIPGTANDATPNVVVLDEPEVTIVVPALPGAARLEIFVPGALTPAAAREVRRGPPLARAEALTRMAADPATPGTFNVLLLASGFSEERIGLFPAVASAVQSHLLNTEPFKSQAARVAVHGARALSPLGCAPWCSGVERLMCCSGLAVVSAAQSSGLPFDEIVVVHDTQIYAGSGARDVGGYRTNSYSTFTTAYHGFWTKEMVLHEFGHSFGDLCDEYTYSNEPHRYFPCANCRSSCADFAPFGPQCQASCDAAPSFFRPEDSVMLELRVPTFNNASIAMASPVHGLATRLQYFTGSTSLTVPGAPTGLTSEVDGNTVTLRWNPSSADFLFAGSAATSYTLQAGTAPGVFNMFTGSVGNTTMITAVVPNGTYYWRVIGVNAAGSSPPSGEAQVTVGPVCLPPGAPQTFTHSVGAGRVVTLSWAAPASGAAPFSYIIDAGNGPGLSNVLSAPVGGVTSLAVQAPPGTYFVRVRAANACAASSPVSNEQVIVVP